MSELSPAGVEIDSSYEPVESHHSEDSGIDCDSLGTNGSDIIDLNSDIFNSYIPDPNQDKYFMVGHFHDHGEDHSHIVTKAVLVNPDSGWTAEHSKCMESESEALFRSVELDRILHPEDSALSSKDFKEDVRKKLEEGCDTFNNAPDTKFVHRVYDSVVDNDRRLYQECLYPETGQYGELADTDRNRLYSDDFRDNYEQFTNRKLKEKYLPELMAKYNSSSIALGNQEEHPPDKNSRSLVVVPPTGLHSSGFSELPFYRHFSSLVE